MHSKLGNVKMCVGFLLQALKKHIEMGRKTDFFTRSLFCYKNFNILIR